MARARVEEVDRIWWNHTSALLAKLHNAHWATAKSAADFNPHEQAKKKAEPVEKTKDLSILGDIFDPGWREREKGKQ